MDNNLEVWLREKVLINHRKGDAIVELVVYEKGFATKEELRACTDAKLEGMGFREGDINRLRSVEESTVPVSTPPKQQQRGEVQVSNTGAVLAQAINGGSITIENAVQTIHNVTQMIDRWTEEDVVALEAYCRKMAEVDATVVPVFLADQSQVDAACSQEQDLRTSRKLISKKVPPSLKGSPLVGRVTSLLDATLKQFELRVQMLKEGAAASRVVEHFEKVYSAPAFRIKDFGRETKLGERGMGFSFVKVRVAQWNERAEHAALKGDKQGVREALEKGMREMEVKDMWEPQRVNDVTSGAKGHVIHPKRVMIQGEAGAGKTTLLKRIAYEWARQKLWRHLFDVVIFFRLRDIPEGKRETLQQVLESLLEHESTETIKNFLSWCRRWSDRILWLLDGWDEIDISGTLERIRDKDEACVQYLVAGYRPEAAKYFKGADLQLTIHGFTPRGIDQFIRLFFGEWDPSSAVMTLLLCLKFHEVAAMREVYRQFGRTFLKSIMSQLKGDVHQQAEEVRQAIRAPWLKDACRLPLMLTLVCMVAPKLRGATRKTDIYKLVIDQQMERFAAIRRIPELQKVKVLNDLRIGLERVAWQSFRERKLILTSEEIMVNSDIAGHLIRSGLLTEEGVVEGTSTVSYAWPHFTIQEFLAASHVCSSLFEGDVAMELREVLKFEARNIFFGFVCGIGGRASQCWDQWYPKGFGDSGSDVMVDVGPVVWIEEGGKQLERMLEVHWREKFEKFGDVLVRTAAHQGCETAFEFFLPHADLNRPSPDRNKTPLHLACESGHLNIVMRLVHIKAGFETKDGAGRTPLSRACSFGHLDVVRYLVENKADIEVQDNRGGTAMHFACREGHLDVVRYLVANKASIEVQNIKGSTSMHWVCKEGHLDIVRYLVESKANIEAEDDYGYTPMHFACQWGHLHIIRYLVANKANIEVQDNRGGAPMHLACVEGHLDVVRYLIENKANIEVRDNRGDTPMHLACQGNHLDVVRYLVENKANIEVRNDDGGTSMHFACQEGHLDVVQYLIENNANIEARNNTSGLTSMHFACQDGRLDVVRYLIENKANIEAQDEDGWTPMLWACRKGRLVIVRYLVENKASIEAQDNDGETSMHFACQKGHFDIIRYLVANKANIEVENNSGGTPMHFACQEGRLGVVRYLVENKANIEAQNNDGDTPMHWACRDGRLYVVRYLVENKANIEVQNNDGETPADLFLKQAGEEGASLWADTILQRPDNPGPSL